MSTEHEIGASVWLPRTRSVMREELGSLRYFAYSGFCTDRRSMFLPWVAALSAGYCSFSLSTKALAGVNSRMCEQEKRPSSEGLFA
jgi:hypothetical protein